MTIRDTIKNRLQVAWLSAKELWLEARIETGEEVIRGREADLEEDWKKRDRLIERLRATRRQLALVEQPSRLIRQRRPA